MTPIRSIRDAACLLAMAVLLATAAPPLASASGLGSLPASYSGVLPCADCAGIRHQLTLHPNGGYIFALTYLRNDRDETFHDMGHYLLSPDSSRLSLDHGVPGSMQFAITRAGTLRKLDSQGREIDSELEYELRREPALVPLEPRLQLHGRYIYMADAGAFDDCRSGLQFPVAPGGAAHELEKAFLAEKATRDSIARKSTTSTKSKSSSKSTSSTKAKAGATEPPAPTTAIQIQPLAVTVFARVLSRPPAGVEGNRPTLFVERLIATHPSEGCGARGVTHDLAGTRWVLTRLGEQPVRLAAGQRELMLVLESKSGQASGYSGCNRFSGKYTWKTSSSVGLEFGPLAGTRMACPGPNLETPFLNALENVRSYRITGAHLELKDEAGATVARFEARNL
jgi:copper homeostasis protein (lipoprotein)